MSFARFRSWSVSFAQANHTRLSNESHQWSCGLEEPVSSCWNFCGHAAIFSADHSEDAIFSIMKQQGAAIVGDDLTICFPRDPRQHSARLIAGSGYESMESFAGDSDIAVFFGNHWSTSWNPFQKSFPRHW